MLDDVKADDFGDPSELPVTFITDGNGVVRASLHPIKRWLRRKVCPRQYYLCC
jgi:hypothetical protein